MGTMYSMDVAACTCVVPACLRGTTAILTTIRLFGTTRTSDRPTWRLAWFGVR